MTAAEKNIEKATKQREGLGVNVNATLLEKIVKGLGIANQNVDASLISATDQDELDRVKDGFLTKKLGLADDAEKTKALDAALEKFKGINQKSRGAVYYVLTVNLGKEGVFLK